MIQDLRYAVRNLLRHRSMAAVAILTLGLGIGGATSVFSVVDAVVLKPLPFEDPDRLVRIWELTRDGDPFSFSDPNYLDLKSSARTLAGVAAYRELGASMVLTGRGEPRRVTAIPIAASAADVLGVRPVLGRMFSADEDRPRLADRRVVVGDGLWRRAFGADAAILGRTVALDGLPFVVTGVMPPGFDFPRGADMWVPLAADPARDRDDKELAVIARLAPGATLQQARAELREIARGWSAAYVESNAGWSIDAVPIAEWIVTPRVRDAVWVLFGAVALLLLLACANVANLLVAHAANRRGEMRVRAALGAGRGRLVRQLFTESAVLAAFGTGAGVLVAFWAVAAVGALGAGRVPRLEGVQIDTGVLAFACLAGMASCLVFGLAPAIHAARLDLRAGMDEGTRYSGGTRRVRHVLVVAEVALALMLLVSAGLLANSFVRLTRVDPGFDADEAIAMPIELPPARYGEDRVVPFYDDLLARVRALPGVQAAGATSTNPFRQFGFSNSVTPQERAAEAPPSGLVQAGWRAVTPGFFEALRIPVVSGRTFVETDRPETERVVIVSQTLARRLWPQGDAVGRRIFWGGTTGRTRTVVGVAGDIRDVRVETDPQPMLFLPHAQIDLPWMTIVMRSSLDAAAMAPSLRALLRTVDAELPAPTVQRVGANRAAASAGARFNFALLAAFAGIALVLAASGVYAMLAFGVAERRREIAVRLALGASARGIMALVLRSGLALAVAGVAAGTIAALGMTRLLASLLFGVASTDPLTFTVSALLLLAAAALACYLPARQAGRLDPLAILRQ
jgi:putative ABC transport system permease protein